MKELKNRIRDLREDRDLRQIDVANATGLDQKTLSNYETGKTNPDSVALVKLADFFEVSVDYLLGYCDTSYRSHADVLAKLDRIESDIRDIRRFLKSE